MNIALLLFVVLFAMLGEGGAQDNEVIPVLTKERCTGQKETKRNEVIAKSRCGAPKDVFIYLRMQAAHEQVNPQAVWVKRCVGLCNYDAANSKCVAIEKHIKHIPVRIYNVKSNLESCSTYPVEEHDECSCCLGSATSCDPLRRMYGPPVEVDYDMQSI